MAVAKTRPEQAGGQAFGPDRALREPIQPLPAGDRLVRPGQSFERSVF